MTTLPADMRIEEHERLCGPSPYPVDDDSDLSFDNEDESDSEELEFDEEVRATLKRVINGESEMYETQ